MRQQSREMRERVAVEHDLSLLVRAGDDVADGPQRRRLHFDVLMRQQRDQLRHDARLYHHLDLVVATVCEVAYGPYCVY